VHAQDRRAGQILLDHQQNDRPMQSDLQIAVSLGLGEHLGSLS
jgi:hypothetical protein